MAALTAVAAQYDDPTTRKLRSALNAAGLEAVVVGLNEATLDIAGYEGDRSVMLDNQQYSHLIVYTYNSSLRDPHNALAAALPDSRLLTLGVQPIGSATFVRQRP